MKPFFGIIFIIFILLLANFGKINSSMTNADGIEEYSVENFSGSLDSFLEVQNLYNMANSYYELADYQNAVDIYEELPDERHYIYHNLGNSYYKLARQETLRISKRIDLLKKSLLNYESAEILKPDEKTQKNIEVVKKELDELEALAEEQESETEQENQEGENGSGGEEGSESEGEEQQGESEDGEGGGEEESEQNNGESGEESGEGESEDSQEGGEGENGGSSGLTEQEQEAIDNYEERLEESQGNYGEFYNKIYNEQSSDLERIFGSDPRFDNRLLDEDEKKDW